VCAETLIIQSWVQRGGLSATWNMYCAHTKITIVYIIFCVQVCFFSEKKLLVQYY